jgi:hypothetical protein
MKWLLTILLLFPFSLFAQDTLLIEGQTFVDTISGKSYGVTLNRTAPVKFIFKNNSVTGRNVSGYMLEAGFEVPSGNTENLKGEIITGNYFNWVGDQNANTITHGIFTGYNTDVKVMYNFLNYVPMGIIRKSNGMTDSTGVVAYNIIRNPPAVGVVVKGMNGVRIYNNTFYSEDSTYVAPGIGTWRGLIDVYTNTDTLTHKNAFGYAKNVKIKNNIFYTKRRIINVNVMDTACLEGFECDYNIYWCESGEPLFRIAGQYLTFTQWQARGYDLHSMVMNPYFINTTDLVPERRIQWGTPTEFDMGIAASDYWVTGFDPVLVRQGEYWQQGARIYEGDMVIFFRSGHLFYGDSTHVELSTGKIVISQGELIIEQ